MVIEVVKELEAAKAKVAELEQTLAKERKHKLAGLPAEYGFNNLAAFVKALKDASTGASKNKGVKAEVGRKRSKRARITLEVKERVKALVAGGKTGAEIAKELGISVPSVQNIKKEFGLVKSRG